MGTGHTERTQQPVEGASAVRTVRRQSTDLPSVVEPDVGVISIRLGGIPDAFLAAAARTNDGGRVRRATVTRGPASPVALADPPSTRIRRSAQPGRLPDELLAGVERLSGMPMDDVRVRRNSSRPAQVGAL